MDLSASAPGFSGAGQQLKLGAALAVPWRESAIVGITDHSAALAWERLASVWIHDLSDLAGAFNEVADALALAGDGYHAVDQGAIPLPERP